MILTSTQLYLLGKSKGKINLADQIEISTDTTGNGKIYSIVNPQIILRAGSNKSATLILNSSNNNWSKIGTNDRTNYPVFRVTGQQDASAYIGINSEIKNNLYREYFAVSMSQKISGGLNIQGKYPTTNSGLIVASDGSFKSSLFVEKNLEAKKGNITVSEGNITAKKGTSTDKGNISAERNISANRSITAEKGNITTNEGDITAKKGTSTDKGNISAERNISANGSITAKGKITTNTGFYGDGAEVINTYGGESCIASGGSGKGGTKLGNTISISIPGVSSNNGRPYFSLSSPISITYNMPSADDITAPKGG